MINTFLSLGDFFERYQTLAILMCLGCLLLIAGYIKKNFPKLCKGLTLERYKTRVRIELL